MEIFVFLLACLNLINSFHEYNSCLFLLQTLATLFTYFYGIQQNGALDSKFQIAFLHDAPSR